MNAPLFTITLAEFTLRVTPLLMLGMAAALVLALNATFMIIAPTHREALPGWLRAPTALLPDRYTSGEVRLAGFLVLGLLSWVVYDMLTRPR